ncbi:MAG TPA: 1-(5-phosphoribosyl)-5-[(5-phosphoribosylamino)methylideneamino]imidazole-4-carboxamide isomerase [Bacteroidales bacterium]|nr:1-(5-phosphoribosyl)-5-[(5-phosphoribosylamino)methylideneamino]imidazole-4-carboxamide isomerase [Bacteroidales bacterium]
MLVIPAIDIIDGKCVRLFQGNFAKVKEYSLNPVEQAKVFADMGLEHLHLIDLDGAKDGTPKNLNVLEQVVKSTPLKVDFGGGLRSVSAITDALNAGAWKVNVGSMLSNNSVSLTNHSLNEKIIAAVDCENYLVKTNGWQNQTTIKVDELLNQLVGIGIYHFAITDIARDGTLSAPAVALYEDLRQKFSKITLWASGGVSSHSDVINLQKIKVDGVIVGKAYYENKLNLKELLRCLQNE